MKLQHIAAAVLALTAFGSANAAIATGGNGSLVLIAYDKNPTGSFATTAGVFDLGLTMDDLIGSTGNGTAVANTAAMQGGVKWDLVNNTITVGTTVTSFGGTNDWTAAWSRLLANTDANQLSFVVTAFDTVGFGAANRSLITGKANSTATFTGTNATGVQAIAGGKNNDIFTPIVNKGTIASAANGAYTFIAADATPSRVNGYAMAGDAFGNEWRSNNSLIGETLASDTTSLYIVDGLGKRLELGTLSLSAANGTLTLAVPEPTTYALLVTGLAVVGAVARRRRAA